ncbi:MAG: GreA/GreB family elongation factor [bacterium]
MDKADIITQFRAKNQEEFDNVSRGKGVDTDPERIAKRLEELKASLAAIQEVTPPKEIIEVGALVTYEEHGHNYMCLILPGCVGEMLERDGGKVACVSPDSHIALAFLGKKVGDEVEAPAGKILRKLKVVKIE